MITLYVFCVISFALSIDYSIGLISTQAYWERTGGNKNLAGLVFGLYDGFTIIVTPILAYLIDSKKLTYKSMFIGCTITNIIGNLIYIFAYFTSSWVMVLVGRTTAGIGASCVPLLMCYVADRIEKKDQQNMIGYVKYIAALSRSVGPILGSIFSAFVVGDEIINLYTLAGWVPVLFALITLFVIFTWTEDNPLIENKMDIMPMNITSIICFFIPVWIIGFVSTFIYWFYVGNAFVLGTHFFHIVNNNKQLGNLYYSGLGGYALAFLVFLKFKEKLSGLDGLFFSLVILSTSIFFYIAQNNVMYYVAVGITTFGYGLTIPSINFLNNTLAKNLRSTLKGYFNIVVIILTIFQGVARFIGPTLFTISIHQQRDNACNVDGNVYDTSGCNLYKFVFIAVVYNCVSVILMLVSRYFLSGSIKDSEPIQVAQHLLNDV